MSVNPNNITRFWQELKRRKVIHVIIVYATAAFVIIELVNNVYEPLNLPDWTPALSILILAIGFPVAIIISWIFDISLKGVKKTEPIQQESMQSDSAALSESSPIQEKSIIVLPFENISPDPDQDYFSDGLTEEIITDLSHIHDLLVISRGSAMTFKGTKKKIKEIAKEVNVRYALEGSVRKAENNLRITAQLIDARNDTHLWAEKYSESMDGVFEIQENVSRSIVEALKLKLSPGEERKLSERPIDNVLANDCYLKAKYEIMRFTEDSIKRALSSLQNGLELIGGNPLIYSGMGIAHFQYVNLGIKQEEHLEKAAEYAGKALELDPESAEAHFTLGLICMLQGNPHKSINQLKQALLINPNDIDTLLWYAWLLTLVGKTSAAFPLAEQVLKFDPINPMSYVILGAVTWFEGRFGLAEEHCSKAYKMQPDVPIIILWYVLCLAYNKKYEKAISIVDQSLISPVPDICSQVSHFLKLVLQQDIDRIQGLLSEDFLVTTRRDLQFSYHIATFYSFLNQVELAIEWLENAVDRGFLNYQLMNKIDPFLENIRGEPQFKKLMERVKYEWENFEV